MIIVHIHSVNVNDFATNKEYHRARTWLVLGDIIHHGSHNHIADCNTNGSLVAIKFKYCELS